MGIMHTTCTSWNRYKHGLKNMHEKKRTMNICYDGNFLAPLLPLANRRHLPCWVDHHHNKETLTDLYIQLIGSLKVCFEDCSTIQISAQKEVAQRQISCCKCCLYTKPSHVKISKTTHTQIYIYTLPAKSLAAHSWRSVYVKNLSILNTVNIINNI